MLHNATQKRLRGRIPRGIWIIIGIEIFLLIAVLSESFHMTDAITLTAHNFTLEDVSSVSGSMDDNGVLLSGTAAAGEGKTVLASTSEPISIGTGGYVVTIQYESVTNPENPSLNSKTDTTGSVQLVSESNPGNLRSSVIVLRDGRETSTTRLYVSTGTTIDDLTAQVYFNGYGSLRISNVEIRPVPLYFATRFLGFLLLFGLIDCCIYLFYKRKQYSERKVAVVCCLALIVVFSSLLFTAKYNYYGHDMQFHFARIAAIGEGLADGQFPVRLYSNQLNGYGYPSPLFYGDAFLYIPAILYELFVPLYLCYDIYVWLVNLATCLIAYSVVKEVTKSDGIAVVGSLLYVCSAYRLTNLITRAAVGEFTAMTFLPLVFLGMYRIWNANGKEKIKISQWLPLTVGMTGIIWTHTLTCELVGVFLILTCIVLFRTLLCAPRRLWAIVKAAIVALLANLWFLVPFQQSMKMSVAVIDQTVEPIQGTGAELMQLFGLFPAVYDIDSGDAIKIEVSYSIGLALICGVLLFAALAVLRYHRSLRADRPFRMGYFFLAYFAVAALLSTKCFPWDGIANWNETIKNLFCVIQFPWRYLVIATFAALAVTVCALVILKQSGKTQWYRLALCGLSVCCVIYAGYYFTEISTLAEHSRILATEDIGEAMTGHGEYLPADTDKKKLGVTKLLTSDDSAVSITAYDKSRRASRLLTCSNAADTEETVDIPLLYYDNYIATDTETGEQFELSTGDNNRIRITLPAGYSGQIRIAYREPLLWRVCELLSLISIIGIAIMYGREKKHRTM